MACLIFSFGHEKGLCWRKMTSSVLTLLAWHLFQQASGEKRGTSEEVEERKKTTAWSRKQRWAHFASNIFTTEWLWKVWWSTFTFRQWRITDSCGLWVVCRHDPWTGGFLAVIPPWRKEAIRWWTLTKMRWSLGYWRTQCWRLGPIKRSVIWIINWNPFLETVTGIRFLYSKIYSSSAEHTHTQTHTTVYPLIFYNLIFYCCQFLFLVCYPHKYQGE